MRSSLILFSLATTVTAQTEVTGKKITKDVLDNRDYMLTWNVTFTNPDVKEQVNLPSCMDSCRPPCVSFKYDRTSKKCERVNCSGLNYEQGQPLSWLRLLNGINASQVTEFDTQKRIIDGNRDCLGLEFNYNFTGLATYFYLKTDKDGFYFPYSTAVYDPPKNSKAEELIVGKMIYTNFVKNNKDRGPITSMCKETDCFANLCRYPTGTGYYFKLNDPSRTCEWRDDSDGERFRDGRTIGLVAKSRCCGASLRIQQFFKFPSMQPYYGVEPFGEYTHIVDPFEFYLWE